MATKGPKKKKQKKGIESSPSAPPNFDSTRFISKENEDRYYELKTWRIIKERPVKVQQGEYTEFTNELTKQVWVILTKPLDYYDPEIVWEFYANALPPSSQRRF